VTDFTGTDGSKDDVAGSWQAFVDTYGVTDANLGNFLGSWGVDVSDDEVWAVLNHNSEFAVVPEPASIGLVAVGLLGALGSRRRKGKKARDIAS
jgi:hypothetical protein